MVSCYSYCMLMIQPKVDIQSTLEMFTDNLKLYRIIQNPRDTDTLQQNLNYISNWSKLWLLML